MNVNNLLSGASPYQVLQEQAGKLAGKWDKSGLLEGITSSTEKNNMSMLLENQAKQLVNEANSTGTGATFNAGNSEAWAGVALPLVRRVFGEIVAKDLVSVQPMNLPAGLIFYLDFQYGTDSNNKTANESLYGAAGATTSTIKRTDGGFTKGLYGAGEFDYSMETTQSKIAALHASAVSGLATYTTGSPSFLGILGSDTEFSASNAGLFSGAPASDTVIQINVATAALVDFDPEGIRAIKVEGDTTAVASTFPQFTRINGDNLEFVVKLSAATDGDNLGILKVDYHKGPDNLNDRGDFEDSPAGTAVSSQSIPEINVKLISDTVAAKTRKLKAQWTPEFAQDLNAYHSIDAEAELTSMLSEYISQEIDFEILDMLMSEAKSTGYWSAKAGNIWNGSAFAAMDATEYGASAYNQGAWFQTLGTVIAGVSNSIHQKTLRGGANFLVVSPDVATIIESIPGYASSADNGDAQFAFGVSKVGSLNSRFQVYKNPYMKENVILMGYRGTQFLETGAVYAPYIPLIMTPLVYDPKNFTPRKGVMTRYAKKMLRGEFYGKVYVDSLNRIQ